MCDISKAYSGSCFESASGGASIPSPMGRQAPAMDLPPATVPPYMSPQAPMQTLQPMPQAGPMMGGGMGMNPQAVSACDKTRYHASQCPDCQTFFTTAVQAQAAAGGKGAVAGGSAFDGAWDWIKNHQKDVVVFLIVGLLLILLYRGYRERKLLRGY